MDIEQQARQKLENIIRREGDAGGERRKPYYLAALRDEIERDLQISAMTLEAAKEAQRAKDSGDAPTSWHEPRS